MSDNGGLPNPPTPNMANFDAVDTHPSGMQTLLEWEQWWGLTCRISPWPAPTWRVPPQPSRPPWSCPGRSPGCPRTWPGSASCRRPGCCPCRSSPDCPGTSCLRACASTGPRNPRSSCLQHRQTTRVINATTNNRLALLGSACVFTMNLVTGFGAFSEKQLPNKSGIK